MVDRLLRLVFPAQSERAIAERAAPVLGLSERHVRRLLRQEHDASVTTFVTLMLLAGFEVATDLVYGSDRIQ